MTENRDDPVIALRAEDVAPRKRPSIIPEPYFSRMTKRQKRQLGDLFGLKNFGVNLTTIEPGGESALLHRHTRQDEFIYVLEGSPTLVTDQGEVALGPGMCAGFPAGGVAHHLVNRTEAQVVYLEIGDRSSRDTAQYPEDDLQAASGPDGGRVFTHKDGTPY